jgi:exodeoxyribonuclease VII small subunit
MPAKKKSSRSDSPEELSFEEALANIEAIVESMEGEEMPLEDLVARYEAGCALLKHCDTVLACARERIELITLTNREEPAKPSQNSPATIDGDPDDDNDISLF